MDDVLVFAPNKEEHGQHLEVVLKCNSGIRSYLNKEKREFCKDSIKFLGHIVDQNGTRLDPEKTSAILQMPSAQIFVVSWV